MSRAQCSGYVFSPDRVFCYGCNPFQFRLEDLVEDINEAHVSAWAEMLTRSDPPVTITPLTAYMNTFSLSKHTVAFSNKKIQRIIGYHLKRPSMTAEVLYEIVDKWKADGIWPIVRNESGTVV